MFNADRLKLARYRRKLTAKELADATSLSAVTVSKIENGHQPEDETVLELSRVLGYPVEFFFLDKPEILETKAVSFRSLKKMNAAERNASLAAGSVGIEFYSWIEQRFHLPEPNLIDLGKERERPEVAARLLRQHWGLGDRPIGNLLKLFESKGIRILSLSENTPNVDAYSFWRADRPYMFLNQKKTAERSNFDSAHELGHLVLHYHAGRESANIEDAEKQADQFASAFLMPDADIKNAIGYVHSASQVIKLKGRWKVSAMALATRLHGIGMLTDWTYRSILIELGQRGYRNGEPTGVERETSTVLAKVLTALWKSGIPRTKIADDLCLPWEEIETLIFDLASKPSGRPERGQLSVVD